MHCLSTLFAKNECLQQYSSLTEFSALMFPTVAPFLYLPSNTFYSCNIVLHTILYIYSQYTTFLLQRNVLHTDFQLITSLNAMLYFTWLIRKCLLLPFFLFVYLLYHPILSFENCSFFFCQFKAYIISAFFYILRKLCFSFCHLLSVPSSFPFEKLLYRFKFSRLS